MEVIIKAVNDIQDVKAAHEFLEKFKPKVSYLAQLKRCRTRNIRK